MNFLPSSGLMDALWAWTWRTSVEASVLVVLVVVIQTLLGGVLAARARYVLSFLVLCRLLLPVAPPSRLSVFNLGSTAAVPEWVVPAPDPVVLSADMPADGVEPAAVASAQPDTIREASLLPNRTPVHAPDSLPNGTAPIAFLWALGFGLVLVGTLWRHWRFRNWIRGASAPGDPQIEALLKECKEAMGVPKAKRIGIAVTERVGVPALFGVWRPRLLLPPSVLALETRELRTVLLHELAHLKRRDTLLNWIMIGVRAWHWFNPLVWFAMRRLRADRELVCDAMVLECVGRSDRRLYGETLLKLLQMSPARSLSPSLVPVITPQPEIKRRIVMISNFKKPGRLAWLVPAVLAPVLCVLTFSRAAEQAEAPQPGVVPLLLRTNPPTAAELQRSEKGIQRLEKMVEEKRSMITERMEMVDKLRRELGGLSDAAENGAVHRELLQMMEKERIMAEILASRQKAVLDQLAGRGKEQLRQILPTAIPDTLLTSMLDRLSALQTESAKLSVEWGREATNMKAISSAIDDLNKQIDRRIEGILEGLSAQVASHKATSESLSRQIAETKARDADLSERSRPYFEAKRDLETQQRTYETLLLRLLQEKVDAELIKDLQ